MVVNWTRNGRVRGSRLSLHLEQLAPPNALRYKPEGRGFDSRWRHWNYLLTYT
jgi:hypothetical protein